MHSPKRVNILGAGIAGLMVAEALVRKGWNVTLHDRKPLRKAGECSRAAAAMLAPYSELVSAEPIVAELGAAALKRWDELHQRIAPKVDYRRSGTLVLAHRRDRSELRRLKRRVDRVNPEVSRWVDEQSLLIEEEGQLDGEAWMDALIDYLLKAGVQWSSQAPVSAPHTVDCRGLGASAEMKELRAIRGEILVLHAPEFQLKRPIRLLHPRHPIYLVPRPNHHLLLGASCLESRSSAPVTVRSALEMLSAAYSIEPRLSEASIVGQRVGLRPAFPEQLPRIDYQPERVSLNGLYRHGFLLIPVLADSIAQYLDQASTSKEKLLCTSSSTEKNATAAQKPASMISSST